MVTRVAGLVIAGCVLAVAATVAKPEIAHLAFQGLLLLGICSLIGVVAHRLVQSLPKSPYASGWRPWRRPRPELPRDVTSVIDALKVRSRTLPPVVAWRITQLIETRL